MLITIDKMATRYHLLPGEILTRATTFDLYCMDIGIRYAFIEQQKKNGTYQPAVPTLSEEQMKEMLKKTKGSK